MNATKKERNKLKKEFVRIARELSRDSLEAFAKETPSALALGVCQRQLKNEKD